MADKTAAAPSASQSADLEPLQVSALSDLGHVRHGFFTRQGGVSGGIYESLNCGRGSNDDGEKVSENRTRVARNLSIAPRRLLSVHQIHSPHVVAVTEAWAPSEAPQADAMATASPGLGLGILTADCVPVLFADRRRPFIGAAHAGWKGAVGGVLEATIARLEALGSLRSDLIAVIGPAIRQQAYEVGPEFVERLQKEDSGNNRWFIPSSKPNHALFDLTGYVAERLRRANIEEVHDTGICTYSDPARFFSYRRTTHRGEPDYGRQISAIALNI